MTLIWGIWLGGGFSGGEVKPPIPTMSAVLGADVYGGFKFGPLTLQASLYPNIQTAGPCLENWPRVKTSLVLGGHEIGLMASYLCVRIEGERREEMGGYTAVYRYRTGGLAPGIGGYYNLKLAFVRTVRAYVGMSFLYPLRGGRVPLSSGNSPAPHISYPTVEFHVGWMWGRRKR